MSQSSGSASMSISSESSGSDRGSILSYMPSPSPPRGGANGDNGTISQSSESASMSAPSAASPSPPYGAAHADTVLPSIEPDSMPIASGESSSPPRGVADADTVLPSIEFDPPSPPHAGAHPHANFQPFRSISLPIMTGPSAVPRPPARPEAASSRATQPPSSPRSVYSESTLPDWSPPRSVSSESTLQDWDPETWYPESDNPLRVWSPGSSRAPTLVGSSSSSESPEPRYADYLDSPPPRALSPDFSFPDLPEPGASDSSSSGSSSPEPSTPGSSSSSSGSESPPPGPPPAPAPPAPGPPSPEPPAPEPPASDPPPPGSPAPTQPEVPHRSAPDRLVIAIAGPTSSGKTTLSKLLLHVFGNGSAQPGSGFTSVAIHQDDFFSPNNLPTGPQAQWVECYLEEYMDDRIATRTCMRKGFTVEEADSITPMDEDRLITEYREVHPRMSILPGFNRQALSLQLRAGKNRDTRLVIDNFAFDIAIARARTSNLSADLPEGKRNEIKDYRFLLKKPRFDGPEIRIKQEEEDDFDWKNLPAIKEGELTLAERFERNIFSPYVADPTMKVPARMANKPGYIKGPIEPNSLPPHHCFDYAPHSLPCPELPEGTRHLIFFMTMLRAQVHHWIDGQAKLNNDVGFPGLNVINGKFRGLAFVEGFAILEPADKDPDAEPRDYALSLFLSSTREGTRKRRFERPEYNEPIMKRYMTWRERSYFDGVAWPAFIEEHQWIFNVTPEQAKEGLFPDANFWNVSELAKERGVVVRSKEMGVKETLQWAVETIMDEFENKELHARNQWVESKENTPEHVMTPEELEELQAMLDEEIYQQFFNEVIDLDGLQGVENENVEPFQGFDLLRGHVGDDNSYPVLGRHEPEPVKHVMTPMSLDAMFRVEKEKWDFIDLVELYSRREDEDADPFWGRHGPVKEKYGDPFWGKYLRDYDENMHVQDDNMNVQDDNGHVQDENMDVEDEIMDAGPWWGLDGNDFVDKIY
ncbi:hypothetical protein VE03_02019 [Pseudogymnoascus sp. 23342-1-I1]|nr:hypothetical protein VE03_02019 [Pseudogymnoascus sp. 23342-1-I1]